MDKQKARARRPAIKAGSVVSARGASTQSDLAKAHGVSAMAVSKWLRDPRWAAAGLSKVGPWSASDIEQQKQWRLSLGEREQDEARKSLSATQKAKLALLRAKRRQLELDMEIKRKEWVRREEAEQAGAAKWRALRGMAMQLPRALRHLLADTTDPGKVEEILTNALRAVFVEGTAA